MAGQANHSLLLAVLLATCGAVASGCGGWGGGNEAAGVPALQTRAPDFALEDVNPASTTFQVDRSPRQYLSRVSAWYFGHATWGYCRAQFGHLDGMQADPALAGLPLEIRILGVNGIGHESENAAACAGKTLPWLQDVGGTDVWTSWQVTYRDVILLNDANEVVAVFNLTAQDLGDSANYEALRDLLIQTASP